MKELPVLLPAAEFLLARYNGHKLFTLMSFSESPTYWAVVPQKRVTACPRGYSEDEARYFDRCLEGDGFHVVLLGSHCARFARHRLALRDGCLVVETDTPLTAFIPVSW